MAHESFESEETAALMNREFINIKVDREERPDVDRVYMTFVQAMTGHGGWPMSVWLTPDLQPFVGGTYFPPEDRYGNPSFRKVLAGVAAAWKQNRDKIVEQGAKIVEVLRESQTAHALASDPIDIGAPDNAFEQFGRTFDAQNGGFGSAPKFPRPVTFNFLTSYYARRKSGSRFDGSKSGEDGQDAGDTSAAERALDIDLFTLRKMAAGGIHDHLGGGFHRYSVDRYWHVPHFEKMLYDQAQLAAAYVDAFQITHDSEFADVSRDILEYVLRDMTASEGGFYSAEDADSPLPPSAAGEGSSNALTGEIPPRDKTAEGAFYVWTEGEIDAALGEGAAAFKFQYGVQPHGNAPEGSDPQDEFRGKNILIQRHTVAETVQRYGLTEKETRHSLARSRHRLFELRKRRPRPHLDDKIISAWNGLMISAFARAGAILNEERYIGAAIRAAQFIQANLWDHSEKILYRSYRQGRGTVEGFADDYAFVVQAALDLYEAAFDHKWLGFAVELQQTMDQLFWDEVNGGYFSTSGKDASVVLRMKDDNDSAEPAASSVAALNLLRLAQLHQTKDWRARAEKTMAAFSGTLSAVPSAMPQMLVALEYSLAEPRQIVIAGPLAAADTKELLAEVRQHFLPHKILLLADEAEGQRYLSQTNEAMRPMKRMNGKATAYVCQRFTCAAPVTEARELRKLLAS